MGSYNFKIAFAVVFLVFTGSAFCDVIPKPGKWQQVPLKCLSCDDLNECENPAKEGLTCLQNDDPCVTIFNDQNKVIKRGCASTLTTDCKDEDTCFKCISNNCNKATAKSDYIECLSCDSMEDDKCVTNSAGITTTRSCFKKCMVALYPKDKNDKNAGYGLVRSCLDDKEVTDQGKCDSDGNCESCNSGSCNSLMLPKNRLSCFQCDGPSCEDPNQKSTPCVTYKEDDTCVFIFDEQLKFSGAQCKSSLKNNEIEKLEAAGRLSPCKGSDCNDFKNKPQIPQCLKCESTEDCALKPESLSTFVPCDFNYCYSQILSDGTTKRGCFKELDTSLRPKCSEQNNEGCTQCKEDECNKKIYPEIRRQCHKCSSEDDPNCEASPNKPVICPKYIPENKESCTTKYNPSTKITTRGCESELLCGDDNPNQCQVCKDRDSCNIVNLKKNYDNNPKPGKWQEVPLKCLSCNSLTECENPAKEGLTCSQNDDPCVTIFNDQNKVIKRGCASTLTTDCKDEDTCFKCISNNCNKATAKSDYIECLSCDSMEDDKCVTNSAGITTTRSCYKKCMVALYPKDKTDKNAGYGLVRSCLDDKEVTDQGKCDSDGNCESCNSGSCNSLMLPKNRLSCFQCDGPSCEDPNQKSTPCVTYKEDDTCVFIFDEQLKFSGAQCKSSLKNNEIEKLEAAGRLSPCKGSDCNDFKNKPQIPQCLKCESTEDCALKPESLSTFVPCDFNYCYSQILLDGTTKRGCFKELDTSLKPKCSEQNKEGCTQCKEDKCNKKIYPENRRQCHKCSSEDDSNCEASPNKPVICPKYIPENKESCATKYNPSTEITTRGCQSELLCGDDNPNQCQVCKDRDSCNIVNLKKRNSNDLKPGKWQDIPLKCLSCDGLTECENPAKEGLTCSQNDDPCVTIFNDQNKVIKRGCASTLTTDCKDEDTCFKCISNNCNKATAKSDYIECLSCDSMEDDKCVTNSAGITTTRSCYKKCMVALYPKDKNDKNAGYGLVRSCLDDKEVTDQGKCDSDGNCESCNSGSCNSLMLPKNRLSCFQCDGPSCEDPNQKSTPCVTYKEDDTCVFIFDEQLKFSGAQCKSSLKRNEIEKLEAAGRLSPCKGSDCNGYKNKPQIPQCLKCESTEDCALKPESLSTFVPCDFNYCYSQILLDGTTKRGCFKELDTSLKPKCSEQNKEGCTQCKEDKCNKKIYPENRRQCHKCSSEDDGNCETSPNKPVICPKYIPGNTESCVTKFNPETKITTRGCQSELSCGGNNPKKCRVCKDENSCNIINLKEENGNDPQPGQWQELPLKCLKCNDEIICNKPITEDCTENTEQCVTVFNPEGIVIKRGCAKNTKSECSKEENDCFKCVSNKCNKANAKTEYISCLSCDTKSNATCVSDVSSITSKRDCYKDCMVALYPREDDQDPAFELVRSCLDDKEEDAQKKCDGSVFSCKMCNEKDCNKFPLPEKRLNCFQCRGEDCKSSETKSSSCPSFKENDACVFIFDENNIFTEAQCKSTLPNSQVEQLQKEGKLYSCTTDACNSFENAPKIPSCLECDSSLDENCATNPGALATTTACNFNYCFSQVLENGVTKRGCFSSLDPALQILCTEASTGSCTQCKGDNCNNQIYPANRRKCYRCSSATDEKCKAEPDKVGVCPKYADDDSCVTHFEKENKVTKRDCFSQMPCDGKDEKQCQVCKDGDSCNTVNLEKINGAIGIYLTVGAVLAMLCHLVL